MLQLDFHPTLSAKPFSTFVVDVGGAYSDGKHPLVLLSGFMILRWLGYESPAVDVPRRVRVRPTTPRSPYLGVTTAKIINLLVVERPLIVALEIVARLGHRRNLSGLTSGERRLSTRCLVDPVDLPLNARDVRQSH